MVRAVIDAPRARGARTPVSRRTRRRRTSTVAVLVVVLVVVGGVVWPRVEEARQIKASATATASHIAVWADTAARLSTTIPAAREVLADAQGAVADPATLATLSTAITVAETVAPAAAIRPVPAGAGLDTARSLERVAAAVVARQRAAAETLDAAVAAVQESHARYDRARLPATAG